MMNQAVLHTERASQLNGAVNNMSELIVENNFIIASVCFDDDLMIEWEGKTSNTETIITSLVLEIQELKLKLENKA